MSVRREAARDPEIMAIAALLFFGQTLIGGGVAHYRADPGVSLRDLTRYRRTLVENQASERRRLIKLLEMADIKLAGVISDIFGVSGRAILRALIAGDQTAVEMSKLARGNLRRKRRQLIDALAGELA